VDPQKAAAKANGRLATGNSLERRDADDGRSSRANHRSGEGGVATALALDQTIGGDDPSEAFRIPAWKVRAGLLDREAKGLGDGVRLRWAMQPEQSKSVVKVRP
jgi:hypothetical protein